MKNTYSLALLLLCLCTNTTLASSYELKPDLTQIPFTLVKDLLIVEATINGETGNFIFDTGAAGLTLNWNHFKKESWKPEGKFIIDN